MKAKHIAVIVAPRTSAYAEGDSPLRDTAALSLALELASRSGAETIAVSVAGPLQSAQVCQEALDLGCERAVCIRSQAPLDFLGAANLLARYLREPTPDLIVCGDQYADHGNAAVAGALSRLLGWPLVSGVLEAKFSSKGLWARVRTDVGREDRLCPGPVVLAALQGPAESAPRARRKKAKSESKVEEVFADSLLNDTSSPGSRKEALGCGDFAPSTTGVELISEPAELLSRLLTEKLWRP